MKTMPVVLGLLALSIVAFAFIAAAAAQTEYFPTLMVSVEGNGAHAVYNWYIDTTSDTTYGAFSGLDVDESTIVATYWDAKGIIHTVIPYNILLGQNSVDLYFYRKDLPNKAAGNCVTGTLTTGDTFVASGPGWTWNRVG